MGRIKDYSSQRHHQKKHKKLLKKQRKVKDEVMSDEEIKDQQADNAHSNEALSVGKKKQIFKKKKAKSIRKRIQELK